jgi:O-antigen/teichoic acid export membrane protein
MPEPHRPPPAARPPGRRRPLTFDVLLTFGSKVAVLIVSVGGSIVIARALGPSGRGAIAVAFSFTALLIQFGILGLHSANSYYAARDPEQISRILTNTLWASAVLGTLLAATGVALDQLFPALLRGLDAAEIAVVLIGLPAALAGNLLQSILLAEGRMVAYNGVELIMGAVLLAGLVVGLLLLSLGVLFAIVLFVGVNVAGTVAYLMLLRRHFPLRRSPDLGLLRTMMRYGARLYLAALLAYLVTRVNLLLVNAFLGSSEAGLFSIVIGLMDALTLLPVVVALNLFPRVARGDKSTDTAAVFRTLALVYGALCIATIPLAGVAIRLLYGGAFSGAVSIYYWMLPAVFSYGMVSVLSNHFAGRGFPLGALLVWFVGVVVNFAITVPALAGHHDVDFAAIGASVAYVVILVLHIRLYAVEEGGYAELVPRPRETARIVGEMVSALKGRRQPSAA